MDKQQRKMILVGAGYGFGALGVMVPRLLARLFGMREASGETEALIRMAGIRNLALAQVLAGTDDSSTERRRFAQIAAGLFAADTISAVMSLVKGKTSARTALSLGLATAGLAAVAAYDVASTD